ncbi:aldo/keto reductase [Planosporangium sp. 12N6]|uniref:aldo/keto reductase n=1 Tax=Planosporangium spinosum TaxID=3402278 RepID=UPI003CE87902
MPRINNTDLDVFPLALGGNVFGWTADEAQSFAVLDAYAEAGGNFIDTADAYSAWAPGNSGGESEAIIGRWMAARGNRDRIVLATKVSRHPEATGLARDTIRRAVDASLRRLGTDHIDLYYAHFDDPDTPLAETVAAFGDLVREGKVRHIAASNYTAARLEEWLKITEAESLPKIVALQPHYNLVERDKYEGDLRDLAAREGLSVVPYFALASGFLTGKYRDGVTVDSARAGGASAYLDERGRRVLAALDEVAAAHATAVATVALVWLAAQPTVVAPLASARTVEQLPDLLAVADLRLTDDEIARLTAASE